MTQRIGRALARAAIRIGSFGAAPKRRRTPPASLPGPPDFEVYTFVTDDCLYEDMRNSFEQAGFERFVPLRDRREPDGSDPYALISELGERRKRPYTILVHQDVRADRGAGAPDLLQALERLDRLDPFWVVAGNAGGAPDLQLVRRLQDPYGGSTSHALPARVVSLDENFLVFNRRYRPRSTPGLSGFHFYGTDVCLNAGLEGGTAYVIDFPLTHLSGGNIGRSYDEAKTAFLAAWNPRLRFALLRAPTEIVFISRHAALRRLFASEEILEHIQAIVAPLRLDSDPPESQA